MPLPIEQLGTPTSDHADYTKITFSDSFQKYLI